MRLIDADELMEALNGFKDPKNKLKHFIFGIETAKELVRNAPSVAVNECRTLQGVERFNGKITAVMIRDDDEVKRFEPVR